MCAGELIYKKEEADVMSRLLISVEMDCFQNYTLDIAKNVGRDISVNLRYHH